MNKENGFTLIELLAIIIVLAIIAVITVPIILNVLEDSNKGVAVDSAHGYIEAVNRVYYSKSLDNPDNDIDDGIYFVSELKAMGLSISGQEPTDGWVELVDGEVTFFSLKMGDYVVTKYVDSGVVAIKGENVETFAGVKRMAVGSDVCLAETDCFKVIEINGTIATLLAENNIDPSTGYQGMDRNDYPVPFSDHKYWMSGDTLVSKYSNNGAYTYDSEKNIFVDTNNKEVYPDIYDSDSSLYTIEQYVVLKPAAYYVNQYVENLRGLGINVISGRLLKYSEVQVGGIARSYAVSFENYWLGSAKNDSMVRTLADYSYYNFESAGVRPVIYVQLSDS